LHRALANGIELRLKHRERNENTTTNNEKKNKNYSNNEEKAVIHTITYQNQRFSNPNVKFEISKIHTIDMNMNRWEKVSYR
jgi:hypothetical protein